MPQQVIDEWLVWRLFAEDRLALVDFDKVSLDDVDLANRLLDSYQAAGNPE